MKQYDSGYFIGTEPCFCRVVWLLERDDVPATEMEI